MMLYQVFTAAVKYILSYIQMRWLIWPLQNAPLLSTHQLHFALQSLGSLSPYASGHCPSALLKDADECEQIINTSE